MTDDRLGLPSASEMFRLSECSGSKILTESLRAKGINLFIPNAYATLGDRIHASLEGYDQDLDRRASEIRDDCDKIAVRAATEFLGGAREYMESEVLVEERLWYRIEDVPFFSGRPDRAHVVKDRIIDINFKTGTGEEEDAVVNLQMRTEAVLLHHRYPEVPLIGVLLSQPLATKQPEIALYDQKALFEAENEILGIVDQATWNSKRRAGPWCKHCPARAFCPEAREMSIDIPMRIRKKDLPQLPTGPAAAEMMNRLEVAYDVLDAIWEKFQEQVGKDGKSVPGWQISKGKRVRSLSEERRMEFFAAAMEMGFSQEEVESALRFSIPAFEDIASSKWEIKGAALKRRFAIYFEEYFDVRQDTGFLQRVPKRLRETTE